MGPWQNQDATVRSLFYPFSTPAFINYCIIHIFRKPFDAKQLAAAIELFPLRLNCCLTVKFLSSFEPKFLNTMFENEIVTAVPKKLAFQL